MLSNFPICDDYVHFILSITRITINIIAIIKIVLIEINICDNQPTSVLQRPSDSKSRAPRPEPFIHLRKIDHDHHDHFKQRTDNPDDDDDADIDGGADGDAHTGCCSSPDMQTNW